MGACVVLQSVLIVCDSVLKFFINRLILCCSVQVVKIDEGKKMMYVYLFTSKNFADPEQSVNRQIANVELWKQKNIPSIVTPLPKAKGDVGTHTAIPRKEHAILATKPITEQTSTSPSVDLPPPLLLPKSSEHMDVFVSVACHPGHFVFQSWQELHKLEVVMEKMLLHYSSTEEKQVDIEKKKIYAAKVENK